MEGQAQAKPPNGVAGTLGRRGQGIPGSVQDKGHWATVVAEYTWSPHWFVSVLDQYNFGNNDVDKRIHYLYGAAGYINGPHRLSVGYGKRREGIFCVGGVCRAVPASNGFEMTFTSSF